MDAIRKLTGFYQSLSLGAEPLNPSKKPIH